jgi:hypothetical protein
VKQHVRRRRLLVALGRLLGYQHVLLRRALSRGASRQARAVKKRIEYTTALLADLEARE